MVASTNHLDQLDPGLASRPSRFDRKYLFPLPSTEERILYCDYWRHKLKNKPSIKFPKKLCPAIAGITQDFSFAYLKEAFVATLLVIAGNRSEDGTRGGGDDEGGDLEDYELWKEMKKQVKLLRDDMDSRATQALDNSGFVEDLTWKALDQEQESEAAFADSDPSQEFQTRLVHRTKAASPMWANRQDNSRFIGRNIDLAARHALIMTENGEFIDSRPNGINGLDLV